MITEQKYKYYDKASPMKKLQTEIAEFIEERQWSRFHSPKNLAMALTVEAAELQEIFQWMPEDASYIVDSTTRTHIEEEIGDVMIYLTTLASLFHIDPISAAQKKIKKNVLKYPVTRPDI